MKPAPLPSLEFRARFLSGVALCGALAWGTAEVIALQWARLAARLSRTTSP